MACLTLTVLIAAARSQSLRKAALQTLGMHSRAVRELGELRLKERNLFLQADFQGAITGRLDIWQIGESF